MQAFHTTIKAIDPASGEITRYDGPVIYAESLDAAQKELNYMNMGYCVADGEILSSNQIGSQLGLLEYIK